MDTHFLKGKIELPDHLNKELSTFLECVSATGLTLPFMSIFKGKKGWSSDSLAITWLKDVFIPHTKPSDPDD